MENIQLDEVTRQALESLVRAKEYTAFQTSSNYNPIQQHETPSQLPSLTVPDMSYSIQELLDKFTTGIVPPVARNAQYDEDADFDNYDETRDGDFDLADATRLKQDLEERHQKRMKSINELESRKKAEKEKQLTKFKEWEKAQSAEKEPEKKTTKENPNKEA